ncbi:50S ribosomal protein L11 methyltransferase [bacterium]|nr:50S ribosomal protein L11 methyltransferase [bacterium]
MSSVAVRIPSLPSDHELLLGLLLDDVVQGVEERDDALFLFYDPNDVDGQKEFIERTAAPFLTAPISFELIQDQNWNAEWEKTIKPIHVGPFWIRPSWDQTTVPGSVIELIIDPKMSFGTGYHESTRLMMGAIPEMVKPNDLVLDAGTGTGVLAFAALKVGAKNAFAFDIDPICKENAEENAGLNHLSESFSVVVGTESVLTTDTGSSQLEGPYDVVMANINREALRAMLPALKRFMGPKGRLGLAGLLVSDRGIMLKELEGLFLEPIREATEGDWWSVWATPATPAPATPASAQ